MPDPQAPAQGTTRRHYIEPAAFTGTAAAGIIAQPSAIKDGELLKIPAYK